MIIDKFKKMNFKIIIIVGFLIFLKPVELSAQNKIEAGPIISLQSPKFLNESLLDITSSKYFRIRPSIGGFARYYMGRHFYTEYNLSYSFEGGGFKQRKTNLDFIRNEIFIGYTTLIEKRNSFSFKIGYTYCILTNAKLIDEHAGTKDDVSEYIQSYYNSFPIALNYKRQIKDNLFLNINMIAQLISKTVMEDSPLHSGQILLPKLELGVSKLIK